jgi:glyoxylase-like metal-dependent hydrolase (beta-lactamase superfamily II)
VTGGDTNTYLLYDTRSREAALFDVGGVMDKLDSIINEKGLELKYIFVTHSHPDHVYGIPAVRNKYPRSKLGVSKAEWDDNKRYANWENELSPNLVVEIKKIMAENPEFADLMNFDYDLLKKPDILLKDNQVLRLGKAEIRTFLTPGHSRGSICFLSGNALFSGDVLFKGLVGRTDLPTGSPTEIVTSVRRLYKLLADETKVYPGHGEFTDIGTEKKGNQEVSEKNVNLQN